MQFASTKGPTEKDEKLADSLFKYTYYGSQFWKMTTKIVGGNPSYTNYSCHKKREGISVDCAIDDC